MKPKSGGYDKKIKLICDWESPYKSITSHRMEDYYEAYTKDPCGMIEQNSKKYYRIIERCQIQKEDELWVLLSIDSKIGMNLGAVFEDENGNRFKFITKIHYRFDGTVPAWYFKSPEIAIVGAIDNLGEYLRNSQLEAQSYEN